MQSYGSLIIKPENDKKNIKRLARKASILFVTNIQPDPEKYGNSIISSSLIIQKKILGPKRVVYFYVLFNKFTAQFDESHLPSTRRKQPVLFPSISCTNGGL